MVWVRRLSRSGSKFLYDEHGLLRGRLFRPGGRLILLWTSVSFRQGQNVQVDLNWCLSQFENTIKSMDWKATSLDVRRFVRVTEQPSLDLWSKDLFLAQLEKLK